MDGTHRGDKSERVGWDWVDHTGWGVEHLIGKRLQKSWAVYLSIACWGGVKRLLGWFAVLIWRRIVKVQMGICLFLEGSEPLARMGQSCYENWSSNGHLLLLRRVLRLARMLWGTLESLSLQKRMNFRKSSKPPLTPPPLIFGKSCCGFCP